MSKRIIWNYFKDKGFTDCGIAGLMGNIYWESGFNPKNLENTGNKALNMTDDVYTEVVDNGSYSREKFCKDSHGYGLAQWTFHTRKAALYNYAKKCGSSIGDLQMQLDFLYNELKGYKEVIEVLKTAKSVREASDIVMLKYERPADQSEKALEKRATFGENIYKEFCGPRVTVSVPVLTKGCTGETVKVLQCLLNMRGANCGNIDGDFGDKTDKAVRDFQKDNQLEIDGCVGPATWGKLLGAN